MPDVTAFDTLKAADALAEAGVAEPHAKAIASTMRVAVAEGVATGADMARIDGQLAAIEWIIALHAALTIAIAGRLFGAFQPGDSGVFQGRGHGAGERDRTADIQLGKLTFYH